MPALPILATPLSTLGDELHDTHCPLRMDTRNTYNVNSQHIYSPHSHPSHIEPNNWGKGLHGDQAEVYTSKDFLPSCVMPASQPASQTAHADYHVIHNIVLLYSLVLACVIDCTELHHTAGDFSLKVELSYIT